MAYDGDDVVVSFNDSLLRKSDVDLLDGTSWLNDRLIGFCFEYFEKEQFSHSADRVTYISPEVTQFIKLASSKDLGAFLEPLNLGTKQFVFLAVNDNQSTNQSGGTHWSLLLYNRPRQEFQHFDSSSGCNKSIASELAKKLQPFVRAPAGRLKFIEKDSPQQSNGYDCGVYVVAVAEHMSKELVEGLCIPLSDTVTAKVIGEKRQRIKDMIDETAAMPEYAPSAVS